MDPDPTAENAVGTEAGKGSPQHIAVGLFRAGFSCAEAVVRTLATRFRSNLESPQRLGAALGGGIARRGLTCGCVTGCAVTFGLLAGRTTCHDDDAKERVYAAIGRILDELEQRHGSLMCRQITGLDFTRVDDRQEFDDRVMEAVCVPLLALTVELAERELARLGPGS